MNEDFEGYEDHYERPSLVEDRNHRNHWLNRANDLHASAGAIWYSMLSENNQNVTENLGLGKGFSMSIACDPVYHMLCGLALELIMKAVLVSRGEPFPQKHELENLSSLVGMNSNEREKRILRFFQESVIWAGRYPIPRKANDQKLLQYWDLARKVLDKPKAISKDSKLTIYVASGATEWDKFNALYLRYRALFEHQ